MASTKLIDLAAELSDSRAKLEDMDLDDQTIADTMEGLALPFERKAVALHAFSEDLLARAKVKKEIAKRIAARAKAEESRAERIMGYLYTAMKAAKISKIEAPELKLQIVKGRSKVIIDAQSQIPVEFLRFPEPPPAEPDKDAIWKALDAGKEVAGCHLEPTEYLKVT